MDLGAPHIDLNAVDIELDASQHSANVHMVTDGID